MRCSMGQSLHVKRHLGGAGTHAAGVRDKLWKFSKFTYPVAWAKARVLKINEINVAVARACGTFAKSKGPGLQKYSRQN